MKKMALSTLSILFCTFAQAAESKNLIGELKQLGPLQDNAQFDDFLKKRYPQYFRKVIAGATDHVDAYLNFTSPFLEKTEEDKKLFEDNLYKATMHAAYDTMLESLTKNPTFNDMQELNIAEKEWEGLIATIQATITDHSFVTRKNSVVVAQIFKNQKNLLRKTFSNVKKKGK